MRYVAKKYHVGKNVNDKQNFNIKQIPMSYNRSKVNKRRFGSAEAA